MTGRARYRLSTFEKREALNTFHLSFYTMDEEEEETESIMNGIPLHRRRTLGAVSSSFMNNTSTICRNNNNNNNNKKELSWEDLQHIERRRRAILRRSVDLNYFHILFSIEGTCLRGLSRDWLLWFTMSIFVLIRMDEWYLGNGSLPLVALQQLGRLNIDIIGGFLSFFLVLFVNQSNARFQEMYKESMAMIKRIHDVASIIKQVLPVAQGKRIVRYMNAAHAAAYVGLNDTYTTHIFFGKLNTQYAWLTTTSTTMTTGNNNNNNNIITEMERIQAFDMDRCLGPDACHELIEWCLHDVDTAYQNKLLKDKDIVALRDKLTQFRCSVDVIYDYCDQPIHFFYIHFLCLLSSLYLPLFAVTQAVKAGGSSAGENNNGSSSESDASYWMSDLISGLIVFLQAIFVIGLRMLGRKMIDPYGSDLEDLSVLHYIETAWQRSQGVFLAQYPGQVSSPTEEELAKRASSSSSSNCNNGDPRGGNSWTPPGRGNIV